MKIVDVESFPVTFGTERESMSFFFVRIQTDDGRVGWGEACDSFGCSYASVLATAVDDALAPLLIGESIEAVEPLAERLRLFTRRRLGDQWVGPQARAALEIALWDLLGQRRGKSVSTLLGQVRDRIEVYASGPFLEECDARAHVSSLQPLLDRGVRRVKLRTGPEWSSDLDVLRDVIRLLGPDIEVMIDGSETYTLPTALELGAALHNLGVRWFEEPLPQGARAGIEDLVRRTSVPIAYGEHLFGADEAIDAMRRGQLDILQPDASTAAGIVEARRMAAAATAFGVRVVPHVCAGPVSLAANLHLAASVSQIRLVEYPPMLEPVWKSFGRGLAVGPDAIIDGCLRIPEGPGLGVEVDEASVRAHPYEPPGLRAAGTRAGLPDRFVGDR